MEDIEQLMSYIKELKEQLDDAYEEIHYIRDVMESMQDKTLKVQLEKCMASAGEQIKEAKTACQNMKDRVYRDIGNAVQNAKTQGIRAVDKAVDIVHVRRALETIRNCLGKAADSLGKGMQRLDLAQKEADAIKKHIGNFTRAIAGKDEDMPRQSSDKGVILRLHNSLSFGKRQVEGLEKKTLNALDTVDHLHQLAVSKEQNPTTVAEKEKAPELRMPKQR